MINHVTILMALLAILMIGVSFQSSINDIHPSLFNEMYQLGDMNNVTKGKRSDYCMTDKGERGDCLPYYLCDGGVANTDGSGVIDVRIGGDEKSCTYLDVCCLPPSQRDPSDPIRPTMKERKGCGWRNPNGLGFRITGNHNNEAEFGEFPWMVAVMKLKPVNNRLFSAMYIGGGSLIHPNVVLTAAHIVVVNGGARGLRVRAGEWDSSTEGELFPHQDRDVVEVEIHEKFNLANLFYDIALLFVRRPFDLAPNVGLACLPATSELVNANDECFATGWGKDQFGKAGKYQNILKKIDIQVVEHGVCEEMLRRTRLQRYFQLHRSFMCAGGAAGRDVCTGDGGSPLVCPIQFERDRYMQVGVVAWGIQCGHAGVPGVYANVAALNDWVDRGIARRGLDTTVYRQFINK